ncbi:hypothetical protein Q0590_33910 [Rhodocytophaga aerolata]|uniref:Transcriptional regulator n=1 Tax=Rhodocytophaga aerolata TaxID=455078 RepID=A0ABT8RGV4_9BACT|nr:hypothetical protein [Rhodocytophaga aerolata]MDO1451320.1 hypothetical protein [Rhodocytophaga aerolata]
MQTSNQPQEIFNFFSKKNRVKLRDEFMGCFQMSASAFYAKVRDGGFTGEEQLWFIKWAKANGMPPFENCQNSEHLISKPLN